MLEHGDRISARQAMAIRKNSANGDWANLLAGFSAFRLETTPEVPPPFMLAWGELDRFTPMVNEQPLWQKAVPHAESHVLPGVGHIPMFDDPHQTGQLLREAWLDRQPSASTSAAGSWSSAGLDRREPDKMSMAFDAMETSNSPRSSTNTVHRPSATAHASPPGRGVVRCVNVGEVVTRPRR